MTPLPRVSLVTAVVKEADGKKWRPTSSAFSCPVSPFMMSRHRLKRTKWRRPAKGDGAASLRSPGSYDGRHEIHKIGGFAVSFPKAFRVLSPATHMVSQTLGFVAKIQKVK